MPPPLEDPDYRPLHPPGPRGEIPAVVAKWAAASQLRWFRRFTGQLGRFPGAVWARFHCASPDHLGLCCDSCLDDQQEGYGLDDRCCCRATKADA
jgi:hypothetical protein